MTHSIHRGWRYKFTFVWYSGKQGTTTRPMSHLAHYALSLAARTQTTEQWVDFAGHCLLWLLLLRLAAVVVPLLPIPLAFTATRISLMASSSSSIYFFPAIAQDPQSSALFRLLCMTRHSFRHTMPIIPVRYECLLQWQQNRSKATMWLLYKNYSYSRLPKMMLLVWWLYVACYYPTTPTDYPCTTRGMSVGPSVTVNIEFYGYLQFWALVLSELYGYSTPLTTIRRGFLMSQNTTH